MMPEGDYTACLSEVEIALQQRLHFDKCWQDQEIYQMLSALVLERSRQYNLDLTEKQQLINLLFNRLRRLDLLQPLLEDPSVTDILVNQPTKIYIEKSGQMQATELSFASAADLEDLIQRICARVNRQVSEASPLIDARLADGSRVGAVLPPVALDGPVLAIRKFSPQNIPLSEMIEQGFLTAEASDFLQKAILRRLNIFISGGTGSGKTTLLNTLANMVPSSQRIVTIEDAAELQITASANLVRLEARPANTEGKGEITLRQLIRMALRLRPDRIMVGEVRGAEALDMLQAMNTGHAGSMSTGHANSSLDMLDRIEIMALMANMSLPDAAIRRQIGSAIDIVIHLEKLRNGRRQVIEIRQVLKCEQGELNTVLLFNYDGKQLRQLAEPQAKGGVVMWPEALSDDP